MKKVVFILFLELVQIILADNNHNQYFPYGQSSGYLNDIFGSVNQNHPNNYQHEMFDPTNSETYFDQNLQFQNTNNIYEKGYGDLNDIFLQGNYHQQQQQQQKELPDYYQNDNSVVKDENNNEKRIANENNNDQQIANENKNDQQIANEYYNNQHLSKSFQEDIEYIKSFHGPSTEKDHARHKEMANEIEHIRIDQLVRDGLIEDPRSNDMKDKYKRSFDKKHKFIKKRMNEKIYDKPEGSKRRERQKQLNDPEEENQREITLNEFREEVMRRRKQKLEEEKINRLKYELFLRKQKNNEE